MTQEEIILAEAEKLFLEKGFNGTSTTEIARNAGCNQALVHYYFRTKEQLFQRIFLDKVEELLGFLMSYVHSDRSFTENMLCIIDGYFEYLNNHRQIPFMIINELILNQERREFVRKNFMGNIRRMKLYDYFCNLVKSEVKEGRIRDVDPFDVVANIVSLTAMTFISLPIYSDILGKGNEQIDEFVNHRREEVKRTLLLYLSIND